MFEPTQAQIDRYPRDGFLIVERFLSDAQVQRARERFMRVFEHQWETGLSPDEVNFTPGVTAPELTRQLCNVWKADRTLAGVVLSEQGLAPVAARRSGRQLPCPDDWLAHVRAAMPAGAELDLVPIEVPAGGAAFHDGWTFHGSPANQRADAQRRSIISHMISSDTRWNPVHPHPIYSRYRRPGEIEMDEAFFPVLWRGGYRTPWLDEYAAVPAAAGGGTAAPEAVRPLPVAGDMRAPLSLGSDRCKLW